MRVLGWISPGTWPAVVRALHERPDADELRLVVACDPDETLPSAPASLFGRARHRHDDGVRTSLGRHEAQALLDQAVAALGRPCAAEVLTGRTERVVVGAAVDADRLILARDGDRGRLGPRSLGPHTRFVVDHAPCTVELLWPGDAPGVETIPPPPDDGRH